MVEYRFYTPAVVGSSPTASILIKKTIVIIMSQSEPKKGTSAHDIAVSEGRFFYIDEESGKTVFTEVFLRRRGYCCGSGCRHCPYGQTECNCSNLESCKESCLPSNLEGYKNEK